MGTHIAKPLTGNWRLEKGSEDLGWVVMSRCRVRGSAVWLFPEVVELLLAAVETAPTSRRNRGAWFPWIQEVWMKRSKRLYT